MSAVERLGHVYADTSSIERLAQVARTVSLLVPQVVVLRNLYETAVIVQWHVGLLKALVHSTEHSRRNLVHPLVACSYAVGIPFRSLYRRRGALSCISAAARLRWS